MEKFFAAYLTKTISLAPYLTGWLTAIAVFYAMTVIFMITLQWRLLRDEIWLRATTAYYALMMLWMSLHAFFATTLNLPILTSVLVCFTSLNLVFATHHQIFPTPNKLPLIRIALCLAGMFLNISEYLKPFHVLPQTLIMGALFCQFCKGIVESYAPRERWSPIIYIIVAGIFISTILCTVLLGLNPAFGLMATGSSLSSVWDAFLSGSALSNPLMRDKFDGLVFLLYAIPHICLFILILIALFKSLLAFTPGDPALKAVTHGNKEFMDAKGQHGLLKALGSMVNANHVVLYLRSPATRDNEIYRLHWFDRKVVDLDIAKTYFAEDAFLDDKEEVQLDLPIEDTLDQAPETTREVFRQGKTVAIQTRTTSPREGDEQKPKALIKTGSSVFIPVRYNGGIIAVIAYEWQRQNAFSRAVIRRMEQMADYLAPFFASHRQVISQYRLNHHFEKAKIRSAIFMDSPQESERRLLYPNKTILKSIESIHHYSSPLATLLILNIGFKRHGFMVNSPNPSVEKSFNDDGKTCYQNLIKEFGLKHDKHSLHETPITYAGKPKPQKIGELIHIVAKDNDPIEQPTITRDMLTRNALASRLITAIIDEAYIRLSTTIALLHTRILRHETYQEWFKEINTACTSQEISWVAAQLKRDDDFKNLGDLSDESIKLLTSIATELREKQGDKPKIAVTKLEQPIKGANTLLYIPLDISGAVLWLAIDVVDFRSDLRLYHSPWKMFLDQLREVADLALSQIERKELLDVTNTLEKEAQLAVVQSLWLHELRNLSTTIIGQTELLEDKLKRSQTDRSIELSKEILSVARTFNKIAYRIGQPFELDDDAGATKLQAVIDRIEDHYSELFKQRNIRFLYDPIPALKTPVPFSVIYLSITNLLANSIQALERKSGEIRITIEDKRDQIHCHITDSGPGVPEDKVSKIFTLGFSSKPKGGFGLPGSRAALRRRHGDLIYDSSYTDGAKFTVLLPKAMEEEKQ